MTSLVHDAIADFSGVLASQICGCFSQGARPDHVQVESSSMICSPWGAMFSSNRKTCALGGKTKAFDTACVVSFFELCGVLFQHSRMMYKTLF